MTGTRPREKVLRGLVGLGQVRSVALCRRLGLLPSTPWALLTGPQRKAVEAEALQLPEVGEALVRAHRRRIRATRATGSVRSIRRRRGLPVRGQRTKTNAQTAKRLNGGRVHRFV